MAGWPPKKNTAITIVFPIYDNDGDLVTAAAALDSEISGDGATFADATNEATEIATGSGIYQLVLTLGEMNFDRIAVITKTSTTDAKTAVNALFTSTRQIDDVAFPLTSGNAIDVTATGAVGVDFGNIEGTLDAANIGAAAITAAKFAADAINANALAADAVDEIWDEPLVGHTTLATIGQVLNAMGARTGAVNDVGALAGDFDVDGFTEATNAHFDGSRLVFTSGVLIGQSRIISVYTGAAQNCAFDRAFTEAPADNDEFVILPNVGAKTRVISTQADGMADVDLKEWLGVAPNALISGRLDVSVGAMAAGVITAAAHAAGAIDAAAIATDAIGSAEFAQAAADKIWASATRNLTALGFTLANTDFAAGAIDANALAADAVDEIWDEPLAGHTTAATVGNYIRMRDLGITFGRVNDVAATTTDFNTDGFTEATDDHFNEHWILFIIGALRGQARRIRDYTGTGQDVLLDRPLTEAPADNDEFIIVEGSDAAETWFLRPADHEANWDATIRRAAWMMAKNINRVDASTTTVAIKKTDDTTNQFTQTATENAAANPIEILDTV